MIDCCPDDEEHESGWAMRAQDQISRKVIFGHGGALLKAGIQRPSPQGVIRYSYMGWLSRNEANV